MQDELNRFSSAIMRISAPAISMFGTGLPGMAGGSAAEQGAMTPAADAIHILKHKTAELNQKLSSTQKPTDEAKQIAKDIEGSLLSLRTLSVLDEKQADALVDQLHKIVAKN